MNRIGLAGGPSSGVRCWPRSLSYRARSTPRAVTRPGVGGVRREVLGAGEARAHGVLPRARPAHPLRGCSGPPRGSPRPSPRRSPRSPPSAASRRSGRASAGWLGSTFARACWALSTARPTGPVVAMRPLYRTNCGSSQHAGALRACRGVALSAALAPSGKRWTLRPEAPTMRGWGFAGSAWTSTAPTRGRPRRSGRRRSAGAAPTTPTTRWCSSRPPAAPRTASPRPAVPAGARGQGREEPAAPRPAPRPAPATRPPRWPGWRRSARPGWTSGRTPPRRSW